MSRVCIVCAEPLVRSESMCESRWLARTCCSRKCGSELALVKRGIVRRPLETKPCEGCGIEMSRPTEVAKRTFARRRFCTVKCGYGSTRGSDLDSDEARASVTLATRSLLQALIRYGVNNNSDLGMGRDAFLARARENGFDVVVAA